MSASRAGTKNREATECEKSLGKPPPVPPPSNVMTISESIAKRISTGTIDEERRDAYDSYWIEKLACMDKAHSVNAQLQLDQITKIEKRLRQYVTGGKKCPLDRTRITNCYIHNKSQTLKCTRDVEAFLKCVDTHLYRAVRGSNDEWSKPSKRPSYAEKFKRGF